MKLFTNFYNVLGGQQEAVVSILVTFRQLKGVAVGDVLGDVPVVRGTPGQAPEAKDLPGGAGCVADSLLPQHGRADAAGEGGQRGPSGVLVVSAANKFYPSPGQARLHTVQGRAHFSCQTGIVSLTRCQLSIIISIYIPQSYLYPQGYMRTLPYECTETAAFIFFTLLM